MSYFRKLDIKWNYRLLKKADCFTCKIKNSQCTHKGGNHKIKFRMIFMQFTNGIQHWLQKAADLHRTASGQKQETIFITFDTQIRPLLNYLKQRMPDKWQQLMLLGQRQIIKLQSEIPA